MDVVFEWGAEVDGYSFEDSERFEEDSLCSWASEADSMSNNWRGWKKQPSSFSSVNTINIGYFPNVTSINNTRKLTIPVEILSLTELSAKAVAHQFPFELVEKYYSPVPEQLQLRIAFWSFPESDDDIRLYSCLANGSSDEFTKGESLYYGYVVCDVLQIGFHLSGKASPCHFHNNKLKTYKMAVTFDRNHITSCKCTCNSKHWCSHVVALCLYRIKRANEVCLRVPISESLSRLERDQLQKFAQYLISERPQQILPIAQCLIDELLSSNENHINSLCGAPDPTAGPSANEMTTWYFNELVLRDNISKTLIKFCQPSPIVFSDVHCLSASLPPAASEWQSLLRSLKGREPEGIWNLFMIIRELLRKNDPNSLPLLEVLTQEILENSLILTWWYNNQSFLLFAPHHHGNHHHHGTQQGSGGRGGMRRGGNAQINNQVNNVSMQHAASGMCDELISLWRLSALNPCLSELDRFEMHKQLISYHAKALEKIHCCNRGQPLYAKTEIIKFAGFKPAIEASLLDWDTFFKIYNEDSNKDVPAWVRSLMQLRNNRQRTFKAIHSKGPFYLDGFFSSVSSINTTMDFRHLETNKEAEFNDATFFADVKKVFSEHEMKLVIAESLYAHGFTTEVYGLAKELAEAMLSADFQKKKAESLVGNKDKKKQQSLMTASDAVASYQQLPNIMFLSTVLKESKETRDVAFKVGVLGLEINRPPAPTKQLEIKLIHQETELLAQLRSTTLTKQMCELLRDRAEALKGMKVDRGDALLPITLASLIFDFLCIQSINQSVPTTKTPNTSVWDTSISHVKSDVSLGFEAALAVLGMKANICEAEHPLLCEGTRRLRGDLAVNMLVNYKNNPNFLFQIMEKILDKDIHKLYKSTSYSFLPQTAISSVPSFIPQSSSNTTTTTQTSTPQTSSTTTAVSNASNNDSKAESSTKKNDEAIGSTGSEKKERVASDGMEDDDQEWKLKFRCANLKTIKKPSTGLACVDSSAPETTSSDNSPTLHRKLFYPPKLHSINKPNHLTINDINQDKSDISAPATPLNENNSKEKDDQSDNIKALVTASENTENIQSTSLHTPKTSIGSNADEKSETILAVDSPSTTKITHIPETEAAEVKSEKVAITSTANDKNDTLIVSNNTNEKDDTMAAVSKENKDSIVSTCCANQDTSVNAASDIIAAINTPSTSAAATRGDPSTSSCSYSLQHQDSDSGSSLQDSSSSDSHTISIPSKERQAESILATQVLQEASSSPLYNMLTSSRPIRITKNRYKGKSRVMPTVPNQPSEALAYFMFEMAKTVLGKAGGSSTSFFTFFNNASIVSDNNNTLNNTSNLHRGLHLCAFQIGLYALGINNRVSPNWLSRTYSSQATWINCQASEIGAEAIKILIQSWEGHLTPQEAATLADKVSRCRDPAIKAVAAELALSTLTYAQALNCNEINLALNQCEAQNGEMLERGCLGIEKAAKDGVIQSDILFGVAKRWFDLYKNAAQGVIPPLPLFNPPQLNQNVMNNVEDSWPRQSQQPVQNNNNNYFYHMPLVNNHYPQHQRYHLHKLPPNLVYGQQTPPHPMHQMFLVPPQTPQQPYLYRFQRCNGVTYFSAPLRLPTANMMPQAMTLPPFNAFKPTQREHDPDPRKQNLFHQPFNYNNMQDTPPSSFQYTMMTQPLLPVNNNPVTSQHEQLLDNNNSNNNKATKATNYLVASFRVGMIALDSLSIRVHDDRAATKYSKNPAYGEDVKWLMQVAMKLGPPYVQQFCTRVCTAVLSPFVLLEVEVEVIKYFNGAHWRPPFINTLLQKCLQMFVQCTHTRIHHISTADYDDFVSIVCAARQAFMLIDDGESQFSEFLSNLRRLKSCKRDLWQRITTALNRSS